MPKTKKTTSNRSKSSKKTTSNRTTSSKKKQSQKEEDKLGNLCGELENPNNFKLDHLSQIPNLGKLMFHPIEELRRNSSVSNSKEHAANLESHNSVTFDHSILKTRS